MSIDGAMAGWWLLGIVLVSVASVVSAAENQITKYARFEWNGKTAYGVVEQDRIRVLEGDLFGSFHRTDQTVALSEVKLLPPTQPSKIIALALNYKSHLGEQAVPKHPECFLKPPSCLIAHGQDIVFPAGTSRVDHEGELVVVIGKQARNVSPDKAPEYVLGVTCGNDVSARDWQKNDVQWWRAKGCDTFGPCGPWIVSGLRYDDLQLTVRVNGQIRQQQRTSDLIFDVAHIVSFISHHMTLQPGDLIFTGTPGTTTPLQRGDVVEVEIEGIGVLRNRVAGVAAEKPASAVVR